ncbi:hypothetical protein CTAYLR_008914 [Chrysophaeum taylorii]|uniref:Methyltransferase type 11 domain-containing protein n=1 Tax=Chrysophaeum taylorii TaxID=2483200 RepID=A0AAD7XMS5_9STRA|nr:hypothetical protein CTAYLR_008914 [Chrysophaeum taylorii]
MRIPSLGRRQVVGTLLLAKGERYVDQVTVDAQGQAVGRVRRYTGESTGLGFPVKDISESVFGEAREWPETPPFTADDFRRIDESDDKLFYPDAQPKFVYHIDEGAAAALTNYYKSSIPEEGADVLDICSSWVSHYPTDFRGRAVGVGINGVELANNQQLVDYRVRDLNDDPRLPFPDGSFDVVTCVVSIDYLTKPIEVLEEVKRVLRPQNGRVIISQSNRLFFTKAVRTWLGKGDYDHLELIGQYLYYAGFEGTPKAFDITAQSRGRFKDPMFVVDCAVVGRGTS